MACDFVGLSARFGGWVLAWRKVVEVEMKVLRAFSVFWDVVYEDEDSESYD